MLLSGDDLESIHKRAEELETGLYTYQDRKRLLNHIAVMDLAMEAMAKTIKGLSLGSVRDKTEAEIIRSVKSRAEADLTGQRQKSTVV